MFSLIDKNFESRLLLGTSGYPSPQILVDCIKKSKAQIVTLSLRRESPEQRGGLKFWELLRPLKLTVLPNTAGCRTVKEAVTTAHMAREIFSTNWIKLEVIGDDYTLQPDTAQLVEAAKILNGEGFQVFPFTTEDLIVAEKLFQAGCRVLMPWGAPIGSGQGLNNLWALKTLRKRFPEAILILDAGVGKPSHATQIMEMGFDAVLLNTAVAKSHRPPEMAEAFALAVESGRKAFEAGVMVEREFAEPSSPVIGTPFWR